MKSDTFMTEARFDVVIAGGGYVGLALAVALKHMAQDIRVAVIDAAGKPEGTQDVRASALSPSSRDLLSSLDVWRDIENDAQPMIDMVLTDSRLDDPYRPVFLHFDKPADGSPFAWMVPNASIIKVLWDKALEAGVKIIHGRVEIYHSTSGQVAIHLSDGTQCRAALLVAADGAQSALRKLAGISTVGRSYSQCGISTTVKHMRDHDGKAIQHFLPAGSFAILPLRGKRCSIVWADNKERAERLVREDDFTFLLELQKRFGRHLGEIELDGPRYAFPLHLQIARRFAGNRLALAGDAAHVVHPIAGQGLNLGLQDVKVLSDLITEAYMLGLDCGSDIVLEAYERQRRSEVMQMAFATDSIHTLFSNSVPPVRLLRDVGLSFVSRIPKLQSFFMSRAAGG
jgi:2-octaprenyl-6-methoxyphenol hydroxylase